MNRWWAGDAPEIYWLETTDRADLGVDLEVRTLVPGVGVVEVAVSPIEHLLHGLGSQYQPRGVGSRWAKEGLLRRARWAGGRRDRPRSTGICGLLSSPPFCFDDLSLNSANRVTTKGHPKRPTAW